MPAIAKRASNKITALTPPSLGKREKAVTVPAKSTKKTQGQGCIANVSGPAANGGCRLLSHEGSSGESEFALFAPRAQPCR